MLSITELIFKRLTGLATDRAGGWVGTREGSKYTIEGGSRLLISFML